MSKVKFFSVCVLVALLLSIMPGGAMADGPSREPLQEMVSSACMGEGADEQVQSLAMLIVEDQVSPEARECYETLSDAGKARVKLWLCSGVYL